jgi:hypothetical protein
MMDIRFVRTRGAPDRIYVCRRDGGEVSWSFPTYGDEIPHDLVHLVVEAVFAIRHGLWGRVDSGADVGRINAQANRTGGPGKYSGFGEDRRELDWSEALAGIVWRRDVDVDGAGAASEESIAGLGARLGIGRTGAPIAERIARARRHVDDLRARWRSLGPKGTLRLLYDPDSGELAAAPARRID